MVKLDVLVVSPTEVIYKDQAKSLILPGEQGVFELLLFHRGIASRLVSGIIFVDDSPIRIKKGAVKFQDNQVTIVCEPA